MLLQTLHTFFDDDTIYKVASIQTLWSGYGEIARYHSSKRNINYIVKDINLNAVATHPRSWNNEYSHQRKLSSYFNELSFYQHYSKHTNFKCKVPMCYHYLKNDKQLFLILEDLDSLGFSERFIGQSKASNTEAELSLIKQGISWLANFHYCFLNLDISACWLIGSYWHLDTRPDELAKMAPSQLKEAASLISQRLNQAKFQTLLHGDAKIANFCIPDHTVEQSSANQETHLAAVDFQYAGGGTGVKDLIYFLGSCLTNKGLEQHADNLKDYYFACLYKLHQSTSNSVDIHALVTEWQQLYCFAWADFERFLSGWAPKHHKLSDYSRKQTQLAINSL